MILLVNQHTVPIFVDIANAFAESGQKVTLFTGHIEPGKTPLHPSVKIKWSKSYHRKSAFTRAVSWFAFTIHYASYLLFGPRPYKILVVTNPPLAPIITAWLTRVRRVEFSILLYDLYPEALFQAGFTSTRNSMYRLWQRINPGIFARAEKIITLSESMKKAASVYLAGKESRIQVIYNWVDTSYIFPRDKTTNPFISEFKLQDKIVILYSGNMGLTHDLESVLDAAEIMKNKKHVMFVLIGAGGKREKLQSLITQKALTNVLMLPFQSAEMFPFAMAAGDIGIVTLGRGAEGISVPSKTYINMAAGLSMVTIAPPDSELTRMINMYEIGVNVEPGQPEKLAEELLLMINNPLVMNGYREKARTISFLFSPANASQYVKVISTP